MKEFASIGTSPARVDALEKVTGAAMFTADYQTRGMLHLKAIRSPHPHARIIKIDISKAENLPGVKGFVLPQDVPDKRVGGFLQDRYLLPRDNIVRYVGDTVALVAADTIDIAEEAAELVKVEYEKLPAVFDAEEAMKQSPPVIIHPDRASYNYETSPRYPSMLDPDMPNLLNMATLYKGDVDTGFAESDMVVENRYAYESVQHCPLEPHISEAWVDVDGSVTVRTSHQGYYFLRRNISQLYDVPISKVRVIGPYVGGGFGSKVDRWFDLLVTFAALKLRRPVRLAYTRAEELTTAGRRPRIIINMKHGVKKDGTLNALQAKIIIDGGGYGHMYMGVIPRCALSVIAPTYRIPNIKVDSYVLYTNNPPCCTMRGVESPEVHFAIEQQMDIVAEKLGVNLVELRQKNILNEGEFNGFGEVVESIGVRDCLEKVVEWIKFEEQPKAEGNWVKGKGIAMGGELCGRGYASTSTVKLLPDGVFEVTMGSAEIGQGLTTVVAQIVAEEFGVPVSKVKVVHGDTATTSWDWDNHASRSTMSAGNAVLRAAQDLKKKTLEIAAIKMNLAAEDLDIANGRVFWKAYPKQALALEELFLPLGYIKGVGIITGQGEFSSPAPPPVDIKRGQYELFAIWGYGAHAAEVAVNIETGEIKVLRIAAALDMGRPINLKMCEQQMDSGIGMGIGTALFETLKYDNGRLLNPDLVNYKIPSFAEIPSGENVATFAVECPCKEGPYGAKGFAEAAMAYVAAAIANAVGNAIGSHVFEGPMTRERVLNVIRASREARLSPIPPPQLEGLEPALSKARD